VGGLNTTAISRLKGSWEKVPKRVTRLYKDIMELAATDGNFWNYRSVLKKTPLPLIPYLGTLTLPCGQPHVLIVVVVVMICSDLHAGLVQGGGEADVRQWWHGLLREDAPPLAIPLFIQGTRSSCSWSTCYRGSCPN
jgi:hypothetical protein